VSTSTSQHLSCPRCHAHVRAGSEWCTLCYGDLRPAPAAPEASETSETFGAAETPAPEVEVPAVAPARRGKHARSAAPAGAPSGPAPGTSVDDGEIDRMLARLAAESAQPLGRLAGRFDSPASKIGLMVGGTVVAGLLILLLMALVGVLL